MTKVFNGPISFDGMILVKDDNNNVYLNPYYASVFSDDPMSALLNLHLYFDGPNEFINYVKRNKNFDYENLLNKFSVDTYEKLKNMILRNESREKIMNEFYFLTHESFQNIILWDEQNKQWVSKHRSIFLTMDKFMNIYEQAFRYLFNSYFIHIWENNKEWSATFTQFIKNCIRDLRDELIVDGMKVVSEEKIISLLKFSFMEWRKDIKLIDNIYENYQNRKAEYYTFIFETYMESSHKKLAKKLTDFYYNVDKAYSEKFLSEKVMLTEQ